MADGGEGEKKEADRLIARAMLYTHASGKSIVLWRQLPHQSRRARAGRRA